MNSYVTVDEAEAYYNAWKVTVFDTKGNVMKLTEQRLEQLIVWYRARTRATPHGTSKYELTLEALIALQGREDAEEVERESELAVVELTERQAQAIHLIASCRHLLNPRRNAKLIEKLVALGVLNHWREVTELGMRSLSAYVGDA